MEDAEVLKTFVRKDVQVRVLPPLPPLTIDGAGEVLFREARLRRIYSYLHGMYLGDGCIGRRARTYRLLVYLHENDTATIERVSRIIAQLVLHRRVGLARHGHAMAVSSYWQDWPTLLPQHGPGPKHARSIMLAPWQDDIFRVYPEDFVRGCVDSDGCRHRRIVRGRDYPAYSFCNHSEDILGLFGRACDLAGIHWTRAGRTHISIARRRDVANLDRIVELADLSVNVDGFVREARGVYSLN